MREEPDGFAPFALQDTDDVGDPRGEPDVSRTGIGLLHADFVAEQLELVDHVGAGARVGRRADRAAADRAGEHLDVRARVRL